MPQLKELNSCARGNVTIFVNVSAEWDIVREGEGEGEGKDRELVLRCFVQTANCILCNVKMEFFISAYNKVRELIAVKCYIPHC